MTGGTDKQGLIVVRRATMSEILELRHVVLRPGRPLESAIFDGDGDSGTMHFGAFVGRDNVGCATLVRRSFEGRSAWQLRGMATAAAWQRRGVGSMLLGFIERIVANLPRDMPHLLWCNARVEAVAFYEKHSWKVVSERFDVPGVGPHHRMMKPL